MKKFLNPRRVGWRNFRAFAGEHELELKPGLYRIAGNNLDTRGDSASGKTTVIHTLGYLLDVCPLAGKNMATHEELSDGKPMEVWGTFDSHEGEVVLRRGAAGFSVKIGGQTWKGKEAERKLDSLCGMNSKLRKAMVYRQQKKPGAFWSLANRDMVRFLVEVLRIGWLEDESKASSKRVGPLEKAAEAAALELKLREEEVERRRSELVNPPAPLPQLLREEVTAATAALADAGQTVSEAEARVRESDELRRTAEEEAEAPVRERLREIAERRRSRPAVDTSAADAAASFAAQCRARLGAVRKADLERERAFNVEVANERAEAKRAKAEAEAKHCALFREKDELRLKRATLIMSQCPTCKRAWEGAAASLAEVESRLRALDEELDASLGEFRAAEARYDLSRAERKFERDPAVAQFEELSKDLDAKAAEEAAKVSVATREADAALAAEEAAAKVAGAEARDRVARAFRAEAQVLEERLRLARDKERAARGALAAATEAFQRAKLSRDAEEARARQTRESLEEAEKRRRTAAAAAEVAREKLAAEQDYLDMVRGFLSRVFSEVLSEIAEDATEALAAMPNARNVSVRFEKDEARDEISPVVRFGGAERPFDSEASGGQETSVENAVDLAVRSVVERRTGADIGLLMLDEALVGLDGVTKREFLEVLRRHAEKRVVLVIEHSTEFEELFDRVIEVEHRNAKSRLTVKGTGTL